MWYNIDNATKGVQPIGIVCQCSGRILHKCFRSALHLPLTGDFSFLGDEHLHSGHLYFYLHRSELRTTEGV